MTYTLGPTYPSGNPRRQAGGVDSPLKAPVDVKKSHIRNFRQPFGDQAIHRGQTNATTRVQSVFRISALMDDGTVVELEHSAPADLFLEDVCAYFARRTLISTSDGQVAIEDLRPGDAIRTRDHGDQTLRWIGSCLIPAEDEGQTIRIKADSLGDMRPTQDLVVSSRFRILTNHASCAALFGSAETLAPAVDLLDGDTIINVKPSPDLEFFNLMFDRHQIITANGLETESYHPGNFGVSVMSLETQSHLRHLFAHLNNDLSGFGQTARPILKGFEAKVLRVG